MNTVSLTVPADPHRVFAVLSDGWSYAGWVVGASHIRKVDPDWPAVGSRIHHSVGVWPVPVKDTTEVIGLEPDRYLELRVNIWPLGAGQVRLDLRPAGTGATRVLIGETFVGGPGRLLPDPVVAPLINARNRESLKRLGDIAVGRRPSAAPPAG